MIDEGGRVGASDKAGRHPATPKGLTRDDLARLHQTEALMLDSKEAFAAKLGRTFADTAGRFFGIRYIATELALLEYSVLPMMSAIRGELSKIEGPSSLESITKERLEHFKRLEETLRLNPSPRDAPPRSRSGVTPHASVGHALVLAAVSGDTTTLLARLQEWCRLTNNPRDLSVPPPDPDVRVSCPLEKVHQKALQNFLVGNGTLKGYHVEVESAVMDGYSDVEIWADETCDVPSAAVLELKVARPGEGRVRKALNQARLQVLAANYADRSWAKGIPPGQIFQYGVVFEGLQVVEVKLVLGGTTESRVTVASR